MIVIAIPVGKTLKALRTNERHQDRNVVIAWVFKCLQCARCPLTEPRGGIFPVLIRNEFGKAVNEIKTSSQTLAIFEYSFKPKSMLAVWFLIRRLTAHVGCMNLKENFLHAAISRLLSRMSGFLSAPPALTTWHHISVSFHVTA